MADLQPPKQAPEDPGAHELDGTDAPFIGKSDLQDRLADKI